MILIQKKNIYRFSKQNVFLDDFPGEPADVLPDPILVDLDHSCQFPVLQLRARHLHRTIVGRARERDSAHLEQELLTYQD